MSDIQSLLFVRHGETIGNLEQIAHGQTESPLNHRGIKQATETAGMLVNWQRSYDLVYASPLSRAQHTGQIIADALNLSLHTKEDLKEGSLGDWEEVSYEELDQLGYARKSIRDDDFMEHRGESPNQLGRRIENAVAQIKEAHPSENIIIVSHGAAIAHFLARILKTKPAFGYQYLMHNAAITEVDFTKSQEPAMTIFNRYEHLPIELRADPLRKDQNVQE